MVERRRDSGQTKRDLLGAARVRFMRLGFDGTTLRDVAADAGVNLALIKRYFDSKEGLFKAALAATPGPGEFPSDRDALVAELSRQLSVDAWPEFGEHPVLMLLRVSENENVEELRRKAMEDFSNRLLEVSGDGEMLRAQLLLALGVGVAVIRSGVGLQPLSGATAEDLAGPIKDVVDALLKRSVS
ncbi:TetR family transcriptional regulator [Winogradskya consettensis]|uniref:TetR family transcriptional regulator n=1 Tax=Winogradskya consettensis TaxID=113560 RepID=A0A919SRD8_9ACTN|nr:TetR/AcrR family transcriptional regulator [Actinoplanes consettensis]GIM77640.1 TetR family transcriptional regulator [Actinoplanes consettensis]